MFHAEALEVFTSIQENYSIHTLFSYQESGIQLTYDRDKAVARFCAKEKITWQQCQRDGIMRGIKNREGL